MLDWSRQVDDLVARSTPTANAAPRGQLWLPPVDVYETESAFVIEADLPGVHRENVDIQFDRGALKVVGMALEFFLELFVECEGVGCSARESGEHAVVVQAADLAGAVLDDRGAKGHLAIAGEPLPRG